MSFSTYQPLENEEGNLVFISAHYHTYTELQHGEN